ncbi:PepSY-associated TM helix domain-containing protein [Pelagicoccus sp. SDUM812003]|uniref:PepSY-associated TM helix domain-containing protein n=1 Tax=Pelagicoccus sp. SDUM812003 TaxID=3041267 RepID=UPI00280E22FC|nr:PepSY-associated TM helix domain-containing protein [Pelagicoccus sp. SDUM812003]MDQ8202583.1 PepSY-associated TM helix domain-containing protein [Pelagicoccus sp. SDUM812003]
MRKKFWKLHSWLGLVCGLGLLVIGLTGSVLVFHQEIAKTLHPDEVLNAPLSSDSQRLATSELTTRVEKAFPDFWIRGWLFNTDSEYRDRAYLMKRDTDDWYVLYIDPYTAKTSERPLPYDETIYGWFVRLHYTFFADHWGMGIAAFFALGYIILGVSGIYLHRPFFKALFRLRWGASARILFSDIHKAVGIATVPMNLILGITGAYWNIAHIAHELIEHAHEEEEPMANEYAGTTERIDSLSAIAEQSIPGYALNYIYFPTEEEPMFYLYGQHPGASSFRSLYGSTIWVSAETGEVTHSSDLREAGFWAQVTDAFEPLHFGSFGGVTTQVLWCLAGLSPSILSLSGTLIYIKRGRRKKGRRTATAQPSRPSQQRIPCETT